MSQAVLNTFSEEASLCTGTVHACHDELFLVMGCAGMVRAQRAAGCLLVPERGDTVLLTVCGHNAYVLSVLVRAYSAPDLPGTDAEPRVFARVRLPARSCLEPEGSGELCLKADTLSLQSQNLTLASRLITLTGTVLRQQLHVALTFASQMLTVASRLTVRAGKSHSDFGTRSVKVKDVDALNVGRLRLAAKNAVRVRAERVDMRTEEELHLDGERITIG